MSAWERWEWQSQAICQTIGQEAFYPGPSINPAEAKRVCKGCPVRRECREAALALPQDLDEWGVWGGMSVRERRAERKRRAQQQETAA